jgi:hypothetical protein
MFDSRHFHSVLAVAACALLAAGPVSAAKPVAKAPAEQVAAAPPPGTQANYGVKLGGFFTEQHK